MPNLNETTADTALAGTNPAEIETTVTIAATEAEPAEAEAAVAEEAGAEAPALEAAEEVAAEDAVAEDEAEDEAPAEPEPPRATFEDLGLSDELVRAVTESGYVHPTPIQEQAIPIVLMGRDVLGCAQTGTGKTASFTLPMMDILAGTRAKARMPRSLILEPTRELALQVAEQFVKYGKYLNLNHALLIGGESMDEQKAVLEKGVDVLIATPGRLLDLFDRGRILMADCKLLVIDEADRMLDMGFIPDVERIGSIIPALRQTLFFSATMAPEIRRLADAFLQNPKEITVSRPATVATTITTGIVYVQERDKREALRRLIRQQQIQNALIFCNRKVDVDILYKSLRKHGFSVGALHGDMDQSARFATLSAFKNNEIQILVCSDVAARGLDIGGLSHVFNFDVPFHSEDYVHRIGRTGRAGREGNAYSIATADDGKLVQAIEKLTGAVIPRIEIEGLDPVTDEEIAEAATRKRGRNGRALPASGRGRDGGRGERGGRGRRDEEARPPEAREDRPRREERSRDDRGRDDRSRRAEEPRSRDRDDRPRRDEPRRDDYRRDDRQDRGGRDRSRDRDDLGPSVVGFGDSVPAFMLIPIPRPRREAPAAAVAEEAIEDAA
ncbi:DEAD/DEAH box helicase [Roseococcus sp. YIM B11640]|uniref:DEAD/DEAH box helicase n=1 Tax=Roseococcus sp. YIM B11640 TaxID=3133973 RepID=UPI003C7C670A